MTKHLTLRLLCSLMLVATTCLASIAQSVSFVIDAPKQVVQGSKFNVSYVLKNAEGTDFREPEVQGLQKLYGPTAQSSYSSQWINGKQSSSSAVSYTFVFKATKAGKVVIPAASITVDGKRMSSGTHTIEVLPPDQAAQASQQQPEVRFDDPDTQQAGQAVTSKDIFIKISMSKANVYEQEAVVCTIKLYTKYQISQFMPTVQPSFDGFLIEDLPVSASLNTVEHVGGSNYMTAELKKCILYPQKSGKLTINSGNYDVSVVQYERIRSIFGYVQQPVEKQLKVKSNSATVNITPLPTPKPASFTGAVGQFAIKATVNPQQLRTYEAATYNLSVTGTGNIKYVKAPEVNFPSQFDVYDPQHKENVHANGGTMSGSKGFEYTFIPQHVGTYDIPAVEFTYFDVAKRQYVTVSTEPYHLTVAKGSGTPQSSADAVAKGIEQKNRDILHIKQGDLNLQTTHIPMLSQSWYWLIFFALPLLCLAGLLFYYRKQLKDRANVDLLKTKRANKVAKRRLKLAKKHMSQNDSTKFYAEILTAVWGYLSDKLGIPASELNRQNIQMELTNYGVAETDVNDLIELLDKCEFAQYAPELSGGSLNDVYNSTADVMDRIENTKRRRNTSNE